MGEVLKHGGVEIEGVVLLGEVADLAAVAVFDDAGVGVFDVGEQAQGGGFSGAVVAEDDDAGALSTARLTPAKTMLEPYALEMSLAMMGVRPQGAGSGKRMSATLSCFWASEVSDRSRSARRIMFWAATAWWLWRAGGCPAS